MKKYIAPSMEIVEFDNEDVITTSDECTCESHDEEESCVGDL